MTARRTAAHFGGGGRVLAGYFTPAAAARRRQGIVILPPLFHEFTRTHRLVADLGERLAGAGYDVFTFDYFGTGDSGGTAADVTLDGMSEDAAAAVEELVDTAEVGVVHRVALRAGVAAAAGAAAASPKPGTTVAWDPVGRGDEYLRALRSLHDGYLRISYPHGPPAGRGEGGGAALCGYVLSERLGDELTRYAGPPAVDVTVRTAVDLPPSEDPGWDDPYRLGTRISAPRLVGLVTAAFTGEAA